MNTYGTRPFVESGMNGDEFLAMNARERAYYIIREKIIYMELKPGMPVSDKVLAEQLEMSRTPVREALILLSANNMVVLKPQSGTFVAPIDGERVEIEEFVRLSTEKEVVKRACAEKTDKLSLLYENNIKEFERLSCDASHDNIYRLHILDNDFHKIAYDAIGKTKNFFHIYNSLQHIERLRVLALMMDLDKNINCEHQKIARAIIDGDEKMAVMTLDDHMGGYQSNLKLAKTKYPEYFQLG